MVTRTEGLTKLGQGQSIASEKKYNLATRPQYSCIIFNTVKKYADLIGNYKN